MKTALHQLFAGWKWIPELGHPVQRQLVHAVAQLAMLPPEQWRQLEEVGSKRIRINLDPANLLEVNSLEEMFDQLAPWTGSMHAKGRKLHFTQGIPTGQGDLDHPKLVKLAAELTPGVPMFIEYVTLKTYRPALAHLRAVIKAAGPREV